MLAHNLEYAAYKVPKWTNVGEWFFALYEPNPSPINKASLLPPFA